MFKYRIAYTYYFRRSNGAVILMHNVAYPVADSKEQAIAQIEARHETVRITTCEEWNS